MTDRQNEGGDEERHEVKFAAYSVHYDALLHWVRMHAAGFVRTYPERRVNNVYFDTADYRAFSENLAGVSERSKLRYRWYGDSEGPAPGALEVKQRRNHFGWKKRYAVPEAPWQPGDSWHRVRAAIRATLPMEGRLWFDQAQHPVMINRYTREYFATTDGELRLTLDREQGVWDQRMAAAPNFTRRAILQDTLVVEIKFPRSARHRATGVLSEIPVRVGRHSKYMNAVRSIGFY